ncbi:hypothetical protein F5Y15DRAFT_208241 [Xylariaceae sp. FL0016]|nr:hypothetical protein F5Y15DRAFT_208241 [Xylariaceae sp. FL0016]
MKFTTSLSLLALAASSSVSAAALERRESKDDFDSTTVSLKSQGLCRIYDGGLDPEYSKFEDLCEPTCGDIADIVAETGETASVSCFTGGQGIPTYTDYKDNTYNIGICLCNLPLVNFIADSFVEALPAIGLVTCAVWKQAIVDGTSLATGALPGNASGTVQTLIKVAKMIAKVGKGAGEYEEYVKKHLEDGDACDLDFESMFELFTGISEDDLQNISV